MYRFTTLWGVGGTEDQGWQHMLVLIRIGDKSIVMMGQSRGMGLLTVHVAQLPPLKL